MKRFLAGLVRRAAPRTYANLRLLSDVNSAGSDIVELLARYDAEVRELRAELNEVRRDNLRVVEIYDLVFERLRQDMPLTAKPVGATGDRAEG